MEVSYDRKIKLFAFDIDGTVLTSDREVTKNTAAALKELMASGVQPLIATGRPRKFLDELLDNLGVTIPFIGSNGAVMLNEEKEFLHVFETRLEDRIDEILTWAKENEYGMLCEYLDGNMKRFASEEVIASFDEDFQTFFHMFPESENPREEFSKPFIKMSFRLKGRQKIFAENVQAVFPDLNFVNSGYDCVDLTAEEAHKGKAVKRYADMKGINLSETAVIGDQTNDITMLQMAGLPIAMGNAVDELKAIAHWIAPTNNEEGAAWAMRKIMEVNEKIA
jgi:Cof subfamily protein (haloacid dehalogenase superfamily)